jgi:hypothetical protein
MRILKVFLRDERGSLAADATKAAIAIAFLSLIGAHMIGNRIDAAEKDRLAGLAQAAAKGKPLDPRAVDQIATGSLARDADAMRFDPCELPRKR